MAQWSKLGNGGDDSSMADDENEHGPDGAPQFILQAKAVSYIHFLLHKPTPGTFIAKFLDHKFVPVNETFQMSNCAYYMRCAAFSLICIAMPAAYAHTLMPNPCRPKLMTITTEYVNQGNAMPSFIGEQTCNVEDFMLSWWSVTLFPASALIYVLFWKATREFCPSLRRTLELYLRAFVEPRIPHLRFQPWKGPGCFETTMMLFFMLVLVMLGVSVVTRSGTAAVVAYAVGEIFLKLSNVVFSPPAEYMRIISAKLELWNEEGRRSGVSVLSRLWNESSDTFWLTSKELGDIWKLPELQSMVQRDAYAIFINSGGMCSFAENHHDDLHKGPVYFVPYVSLPPLLSKVVIADLDLIVHLGGNLLDNPHVAYVNG